MARIIINAWGSAGDFEPFLALGRGLADIGHEMEVLTSENFSPQVAAAGLKFEAVASRELCEKTLAHPDLWVNEWSGK